MIKSSVKWTEIYNKLSKVDRESTLKPEDKETLALAAFLIGKDAESYHILEQAHHSYLHQSETEKAVRCAFWLGLMLLNAGEKARSSGWIARGERLISKQSPDSAEKGFLLIPQALGALEAGDVPKARKIYRNGDVNRRTISDY